MTAFVHTIPGDQLTNRYINHKNSAVLPISLYHPLGNSFGSSPKYPFSPTSIILALSVYS